MNKNCPICRGIGRVCENHPDKPYDDELGCACGDGIPCACNDSTPPDTVSGIAPLEQAMKEPMFSIEKDPDESLRIVVTRPDGTRVVIRGGQSQSPISEPAGSCPQLATFLDRNRPQAR